MTNKPDVDGSGGMTPFFLELEGELVRAAQRETQRRHHRQRFVVAVAAAAAIVVVVLGVAAVMNGPETAVAEVVRIQPKGDLLSVFIEPGAPASEAITELRAAGFEVGEGEQATGPSRDGLIVLIESTMVEPSGNAEEGFRFEGPAGASLTIVAGHAGVSDIYEAPTNAFLPDEPLHCVGWPGQAASDLAVSAADVGIALRYSGGASEQIDPQNLDGLVVDRASAVGPRDVLVFVVPGEPSPQPACD